MIKNMNIIIFLLCLVACSAQKSEQGWNLVWSDEFNYDGLPDSSKWGNEVRSTSWNILIMRIFCMEHCIGIMGSMSPQEAQLHAMYVDYVRVYQNVTK